MTLVAFLAPEFQPPEVQVVIGFRNIEQSVFLSVERFERTQIFNTEHLKYFPNFRILIANYFPNSPFYDKGNVISLLPGLGQSDRITVLDSWCFLNGVNN